MAFEFKLPDIGEGIHEGEIVEWLISEGDEVDEDQDIVEVMTDKATVTISSPRAGTIAKVHFGEGETVDVGQVIVTISEAGASGAAGAEGAGKVETGEPAPDGQPGTEARLETEEDIGVAPQQQEEAEGAPRAQTHGPRAAGRAPGAEPPSRTPRSVLAPPSVRIEARKRGIDLTSVKGSGPAGRISMEDLERAPEPTAAPASSKAAPASGGGRGFGHDWTVGSVDREHATAIEPVRAPAGSPRAASARANVLAARFAYSLPVPADKLVTAAQEAQQLADDGVTIDETVVVLKALVSAVAEHPRVNASVDEESGDLVVYDHVHLAVDRPGPDGLERIVVANADAKGLLDIARSLSEGGDAVAPTMAVTALGQAGEIATMPVLDHPQVTAVGVGALREVAVLENGQARVGHQLNLSFSFDHRYVDGYDGALYAQDVAKLLTEPSAMLLASR